ncbi:MAG: hypothetical protein NWE98_00860 [Candidatus Bathyarchaeota archaeon]|nr:hypothetical protein [Candidatus Bathyarchaeota archaeon]
MNKKLVFFALALMIITIALTAESASAYSPRKIPVVFIRNDPIIGQVDHWTTKFNIYHVSETGAGYESFQVKGEGVYLTGSAADNGIGTLNLKNNVGYMNIHSHLEFQNGAFEGTITIIGTFAVAPEPSSPPEPIPGQPTPIPPPLQAPPGAMVANNAVVRGVWNGNGQYKGWTLVLEYKITDGATALPLIGYLLVPPGFKPMPTPPIDPVELQIMQIRDQAMEYLKMNHPETSRFMNDLAWIGGSSTPPLIVGSISYTYFSGGWTAKIRYPVVLNPPYTVTINFTGCSKGITYKIHWEGTWQAGVIDQTNYVFTEHKPGRF